MLIPSAPISRISPPRFVSLLVALLVGPFVSPHSAECQVSFDTSYYVPQVGTVASPTEGTIATRFFRACPNNDGGTSLPGHARIQIVLRDALGIPIPGVSASEICALFNGGTAEQGFTGAGADSIIANSTYNFDPLCPDVTCLFADADTDVNGTTYITFAGADPMNPGVSLRNPNRKWGHYDSSIPVYAAGVLIPGRLTTASASGSYVLRIKNFDVVDGLGTGVNEGEAVTMADVSAVLWGLGLSTTMSYWLDFDGSGTVAAADLNLILQHYNHDCDTPNNP